jgi:sorbitol-specific phosphotransferase system component IIA
VSSDITYVPYQQSEEVARRAALVKVEFSAAGLHEEDLQVLGHLSEAVDLMNPIYQDQFHPGTPVVRRVVERLFEVATPAQREALQNYLTLLNLQNSPFSLLPRKNHLLGLSRSEVEGLVKKAGGGELRDDFETVAPYLFDGLTLSDKVGMYPADMTEEEWNALGDDANVVNMMFDRRDGRIVGRINEERYAATLIRVIECLSAARERCRYPELRVYLDGKIEELRHGTKESRRIADFLWIRHGSPIDLILSTALEVYLDNWKNARGEAASAVYVENPEAQALLKAMVEKLPAFEAAAPWTHRKKEIDPSKLPRLRYVDVLNWSGDYVNSPMTIVAQSLPNDDWVVANVGSVNLVYRNTGKAIHRVSGDLMAEEFMTRAAFDEYRDLLFEGSQIHSALHELGHTTGAMDAQHQAKQARDYLEAEYSTLEEARAESFGMFAMTRIARDGMISGKMAAAGHYSLMVSMVQGLRFKPEQAHVKARNMMYHFLRSKGGIEEKIEDGKRKFQLNVSAVDDVVEDLLADLGNIKAAGDKTKAATLREQMCFEDPLRKEIEARAATFPLGRGLIFPHLKRRGDRYLPELEYPASFNDQTKFAAALRKSG